MALGVWAEVLPWWSRAEPLRFDLSVEVRETTPPFLDGRKVFTTQTEAVSGTHCTSLPMKRAETCQWWRK